MLKVLEVWSADPFMVVTVAQPVEQAKGRMLMFAIVEKTIAAKTIFLAFILPLQSSYARVFLNNFSYLNSEDSQTFFSYSLLRQKYLMFKMTMHNLPLEYYFRRFLCSQQQTAFRRELN